MTKNGKIFHVHFKKLTSIIGGLTPIFGMRARQGNWVIFKGKPIFIYFDEKVLWRAFHRSSGWCVYLLK